jgi:hypothetical protein
MSKNCKMCNLDKSLDEFGNNSKALDGKQHYCKKCNCEKAKLNRENDPEKYKARDKKANAAKQLRKSTSSKTCVQCNVEKLCGLFPYEDKNNVCKDCLTENETNRIKNLVDKTCSYCGKKKSIDLFGKTEHEKDGYLTFCKTCFIEAVKDDFVKHCPKCDTTKIKNDFPSDIARLDGLYGLCRRCKSKQNKTYKVNNKEKVNALDKKRLENPQEKIIHNLRTRLRHLVKRKNEPTLEYLGISSGEYKKWIEYQFDDVMTWDNYGSYWHMDHVVPCNSFNLENEEEIFECFNWTNLRPLNATKNMSKNNKILEDEIKTHKLIVTQYLQEKAAKKKAAKKAIKKEIIL